MPAKGMGQKRMVRKSTRHAAATVTTHKHPDGIQTAPLLVALCGRSSGSVQNFHSQDTYPSKALLRAPAEARGRGRAAPGPPQGTGAALGPQGAGSFWRPPPAGAGRPLPTLPLEARPRAGQPGPGGECIPHKDQVPQGEIH